MATFQEIASTPLIVESITTTTSPNPAWQSSEGRTTSLYEIQEYREKLFDLSFKLAGHGAKFSQDSYHQFSEVLAVCVERPIYLDALIRLQGDDAVRVLDAMQLVCALLNMRVMH